MPVNAAEWSHTGAFKKAPGRKRLTQEQAAPVGLFLLQRAF
jgi:hypothetical protein